LRSNLAPANRGGPALGRSLDRQELAMRLAARLAKALTDSRSLRWKPDSREQVLARLLVKRAEAKAAGLTKLEANLRQQIRWALPMHRLEDPATEPVDEPAAAIHDRL
jgi:hypothetical protein